MIDIESTKRVNQGDFATALGNYERAVPEARRDDCKRICVIAADKHGVSINKWHAWKLWQWWSGEADAVWLSVTDEGELCVGNALESFCQKFCNIQFNYRCPPLP